MSRNEHRQFAMLTRFAVYLVQISGHLLSLYLALLACLLAGAVLLTAFEGMSFADAVCFSFITGLTVGYGDIVAQTGLGRVVSIALGIVGILFTGLVVAVMVEAVRRARQDIESSG